MKIDKYRDKVWKVMSLYIRQRDSDWRGYCKCCTCSTTKHWKEMHAGHFIHGKTKMSYLDERNVNGQCNSCNTYKGGSLAEYSIFLEKKYGHGILQELKKLSDKNETWTIKKLDERIKYYKEKLDELQRS